MTVLAAVQSCYIPWKGYFDLIDQADVFVFYDDVQYSKNSWRNRNLIQTSRGQDWLTIPVTIESLSQTIRDTKIADPRWAQTHLDKLKSTYASSAHFQDMWSSIQSAYAAIADKPYLWEVNHHLTQYICNLLDIKTPLKPVWEFPMQGDRNERLAGLCRSAGCDVYLSGPAAKDYLDEDVFKDYGVRVEYMTYGPYPEYQQMHAPFVHEVSMIDLLFNTGAQARNYIKGHS